MCWRSVKMREQEWEEVNISSVYTRDSLTARAMKAIDLHSSPAIEMCWSKVNVPPTIVPSADAPVVDMCWGTATGGESIDEPLAEVSPRIDMCCGNTTRGELMDLWRVLSSNRHVPGQAAGHRDPWRVGRCISSN